MTRQDITFTSGDVRCAGWFYPAGPDPRPAVVMAHGLAGIKEMRLDAYAERFAAAGYHVLVFDYRHFGASEGQPRQLLSIRRQHQDWSAAVAYARSLPEVDATRIVLWGSSLSGGHVLSMAAELSAAAVIAQVPHTHGPAGVLALGPRQATRLAGHGLLDIAKAAVGAAPHYVPASGSPGSLALMTAPEAAGYLSLVPAGQAFDQRVAGRFALAIPLYSPAHALRNLTMPTLVQVGSRDETTPPGPAIRAAGKNPRVTRSTHETGHFEPYSGEQFEAFVTEQIDFLQHALA